MKVNQPVGAASARKIERSRDSRRSATAAAPASASDSMSVLGVPSAELTPKVRKALSTLAGEIQTLREELDQARTRISVLEALADRDPLLDIFNRRAFVRELNRVMGMIDRYDLRASLVFIDLNDLKIINDKRGHAAGDAALTHVAACLTECVRKTDIVARLGGDEFGVLLLQSDEVQASAKATVISDRVKATMVEWDGDPFAVAVSWGAVQIKSGVSAQEAMNQADEAMYEAKKSK